MRVSKLLEQKGAAVATIDGTSTIGEAVAELARHGIGALVVSTDGDHIDGILSERDIVRRLAGRRAELLADPVSSIMSTTVHTCSMDDEVETLMAIMTDRRIRHVPVVSDGSLVGVVSIGDVVKSRIGELEKDRNELVEYIQAR